MKKIIDVITVKDLTKRFNDLVAVDNMSFNVKQGEIFGFVGPNGAGKTTTIKMLTTLLHPTSGNGSIAGFSILKNKSDVRDSIGVVFQEPALDTELTGMENLDFHARMYGLNSTRRKKRMDEVLRLVDLGDKKNVLVKNYSGGMKRRLEIARGLMHYPQVLFLDEPTLGLDAQTRRAIWEYVKKMNEDEGTTVFLTTHYMDEADFLCGRVAIIDRGKIIVVDTPSNLKNAIGKDVITLTCSNMKKLMRILSKEKWVESTKQYDSFLTVGVQRGEEKIPIVIDLAQKIGVGIRSISVRKPTFDDVFLHYTGRTLKEKELEKPIMGK